MADSTNIEELLGSDKKPAASNPFATAAAPNPFATAAAPNPFATAAPNLFATAAPNPFATGSAGAGLTLQTGPSPERVARPSAAVPAHAPQRKVEDLYAIGPTLGTGAYSVVKEGITNGTGEKVALKMINKSRVSQSANLQKFLDSEIAIMEKIASDIPRCFAYV